MLLLPGALWAQASGVRVDSTGPDLFESLPKNIVTTSFLVRNTSSQTQNFEEEIELPPHWKLITPPFPFPLQPGGSEARLLSFFVPQNAAAGRYEIRYVVRSQTDPAVSDVARIYVQVLGLTRLDAQLLRIPEYVIAGQNYDAVFSVVNNSNRKEDVEIKVESGRGLPFRLAPERAGLAPGEAAEIRVSVKTDPDDRQSFKHLLSLSVLSATDGKLLAKASCAINVVPRVTGEADRFHRLPMEVSLRAISQKKTEEKTVLQGEVMGKGPLAEDGYAQVDFLLRGPDTLDASSVFGTRDRCFFDFRDRSYAVGLGDHYYSLSRLTQQFLDGSGVGGEANLGGLNVNAFSMKTRRSAVETKENAAHLDYPVSDRLRLAVNLLDKRTDEEQAGIFSLEGRAEPFKNTVLRAEAARGNGDGGDGNAYWLDLSGGFSKSGTYHLEYIYAQPDYPGYYRSKEYFSGTCYLPVVEKLSMNATLRQEKNNLDLDPEQDSASLARFGQVGASYIMAQRSTLTLNARYRERADRMPEPRYDQQEATLRLGLNQGFKKSFVNLALEQGRTKDKLTGKTSAVRIYEGALYYTPWADLTCGAYAVYRDRDEFDGQSPDSVNAGLTGNWQMSKRTAARLKVERYFGIGDSAEDRYNLDLGVKYKTGRYILSAQGRHIFYGGEDERQDETAFLAQVSVPFGLPLARKKSIGSVEGRVLDEDTGRAVPNAILRLNGVEAVTGEDGGYSFPALAPGPMYMTVDHASIGLDSIPAQPMPIPVEIKGGTDTPVDLTITRSASLSGRLEIWDFRGEAKGSKGFLPGREAGTEIEEAGGLSGALLELRDEHERFRVNADLKGRFAFYDLRPGKWTLRLISANLPANHYMENEAYQVELAPGEKGELVVKILPKKRFIQMLNQGEELILEEK